MKAIHDKNNLLKNSNSIDNKVSYIVGGIINTISSNPMVHFIDIKNNYIHTEYNITLYCERPGLVIGYKGATITQLRKQLKDDLKTEAVTVKVVEYIPVRYPLYDLV